MADLLDGYLAGAGEAAARDRQRPILEVHDGGRGQGLLTTRQVWGRSDVLWPALTAAMRRSTEDVRGSLIDHDYIYARRKEGD